MIHNHREGFGGQARKGSLKGCWFSCDLKEKKPTMRISLPKYGCLFVALHHSE